MHSYSEAIARITENNWCRSIIGAVLHIFMIDNLLHGNYSLFLFPLDKVDYGWYITCRVDVKNKSGWKFAF